MNQRRAIDKDTYYPAIHSGIRFYTEYQITEEEDRWFTAGVSVFLIVASIVGGLLLS